MADSYDYVIVGAGSAGCVLANRLSTDPAIRVLLLEAGGSDLHPYIRAPAGFIKTFQSLRFNWCYTTEPVAGADNRPIYFPRGKVLGGSSAINGSLYVRGQQQDFDTWAQLGNRGWSFDDVLPYFRRSEDRSSGADAYHGTGGPQHVSDINERHPICEAFIAGAESLGVPRNPDYNGIEQEGVAHYQRTIRNGRRHSAATGYLAPVRRRPNLRVVTGAHVQRLDIADRRACGVTYRQGGQERRAIAAGEVILSAGTVNSPHLLQLSGIGPAAVLQGIGIEPLHELPGVGEGLQDHFATRVAHRVVLGRTLNERARGPRLWWEVANWLATGQGVLSLSPAHVGAFIRSHASLDAPDLQIVFTPASYSEGVTGKLQPFPGMTCGVWQMRPHSRGWVRARSPDRPSHRRSSRTTWPTRPTAARRWTGCVGPAGYWIARRWRRTAARRPCQARRCRPTRRCWPTPGRAARPSTTRSAPAAWDLTRTPSSGRTCGCMGSRACAWWMRR